MTKHLNLILVLYAVFTVMFFAFVKHTRNTFEVDGKTYAFAGMMQYDDNGNKIYVPIFREK